MSFKEKYKNSIEIACYAYDNSKFDVAVNRFYYGVFQKILLEIHDRENLREEYNILSGKGSNNSHNNTIYLYTENVLMKKNTGKKLMQEKRNFNRYINDLKSLRQKADYLEPMITSVEAKEAKDKCNNLVKIIDS